MICDTHRLGATGARGPQLGVVARQLTIGPFGNAPHFSSPAGWGMPWTVPWAVLEAGVCQLVSSPSSGLATPGDG